MNVRLGKLEAWVQARVDSGDYASHAEVIRAGLRLLKEDEEWRARARQKIAEGLAQMRIGDLVDGDDVFARLRAELDENREHE